MALKSINRFHSLRELIIAVRNRWLRIVVGADVHPSVRLSLSGRLVSGRRQSIRIGENTLVAFKVLIISYDLVDGAVKDVTIGKNCFIGGGSVILPGVAIGDGAIVGAGSFVFENVAAKSIVGGNPARVLRTNVEVGAFGRLASADDAGVGWRELG